jgi:predicted membrane-bound spermidine synthase
MAAKRTVRGFDGFAALVYVVAFVTGTIVMSFEMLGSRYLNPFFGSGIYTWAALISTVLAALTMGYFIGGWLADKRPSAAVLGLTVLIGSAYLIALPAFDKAILELVLAGIDDIRTGSLAAALAIMFFPVTFLGMYSPFAIRLLLQSPQRSGTVSGTVYGISTAGSIFGTLGTTFFLIPMIGSRAITISLGVVGVAAALLLIASSRLGRAASTAVALVVAASVGSATLLASALPARGQELLDHAARAALLKRKDGQLDHIETTYNDIFITKERALISMSFQLKGWDYTQSTTNLRDADDLPMAVARTIPVAVAHAQETKRILMIGLGGGTVSAYLGRFLPEAAIDTVEIDPGVIKAAKTYFGLRETQRVRYLDGDGRVFLNRNREPYDIIIMDAFHGGYVPFHLATREFYELVKQRLKPGGVAAFTMHDGTKLYVSTIVTLRQVFPSVDLYASGEGEVIAVTTTSPPIERAAIARNASTLQEQYRFRFPLPQLAARHLDRVDVSQGMLLTDDFSPADLYNALRQSRRRKN